MKKAIFSTFLFSIFGALALVHGQNSNPADLIQDGVKLHDEGKYKEAIEKYSKALELDPKSTQATYELSLSYLELKDYENAIKYSGTVIMSDDKKLSAGAYAVKSEALAAMGRVDDAIALLKEGLSKNGEDYLLNFNLALNYYNKGDTRHTLEHIKRAIDLDKTHSGAFLLNAYASKDSGLWVQSILSFQMFLLLEPDSKRSRNAFEEMLSIMRVKSNEEPIQRSFIQQQMMRSRSDSTRQADKIPPLDVRDGLNRKLVYETITQTIDSLQNQANIKDDFTLFSIVNQVIIKILEEESKNPHQGVLWTFYVPFFSHIAESEYYETYCRYVSVSYIPESLEWWKQNPSQAMDFVLWFENGDNDHGKS